MQTKQAVIIVSHGSRNQEATQQFNLLIENVKKRKQDIRIEAAFFSLASPSLVDVIKKVTEEGFTKVSIVPFFLIHGNHIAYDIPKLIEEEKKKYPDVTFTFGSTLCSAKHLESLVLDRIEEVSA